MKFAVQLLVLCRDSSISKVTGYGLEDQSSITGRGGFLFAIVSKTVLGPT
jgi:hypothetical protein